MKFWITSIFRALNLNVATLRIFRSSTRVSLLVTILSLIFTSNGYAETGYPNWQIESDLLKSVAYEKTANSQDYLYIKSQYISAGSANAVTSMADFHAQMKLLGTRYLPKPLLIPVGMDGLPIFIPTYPLPKRVGDPFVERLIILDQLRSLFGSTIMAGRYESEPALINALYSSGKEYARLNNLVLGSPLALSAWQASGYGDIIWPEFRVIQGETVLVPVVYLSAQSINTYAITDHINDPSVTSATLNSLTISPSASMNIRTEVLTLIDGLYVNGSITVAPTNREIVVGGALDIYGGSITAETNLSISARAINLRPLVIMGETLYGQEEIIANVASVAANNGTMLLNAYRLEGDPEAVGNILAVGAQISGKNVTLQAAGNIDILAAQLQKVSNEVIRGGSHDTSAITFVQSQVSGVEAIDLIAGGYVNVKASDLISAEGTINILAGNGIYIENEFGVVQEQMHQKVGKTTRDMSHFQTMAISANLRAGKGIVLNTEHGPIRLKAANITSKDGAKLTAQDGKIELMMAKEQDQYNYSSVKEKLLTIKTEMESWDRDTPVYNTIVGGLEVNATRGITVEYGGIKDATPRQQIDAMAELSGMAGMEWFANLKNKDCASVHAGSWLSSLTEEQRLALIDQQSCVDFGFVELMDQYDYEKKTNLSPAAMAIIAIAVVAATGGAGAGVVSSITGTTAAAAGGASAAMINAAFTTLVTQAAQVSITTGLNGGSPYDAWKALGSKENIRQLATSIVTAGALSYADKAMGFSDAAANTKDYGFFSANKESLGFLDQSIQVVAHATVTSTIDVLAQGKSLSDFGSNFEKSFKVALVQNAANQIGQNLVDKIALAPSLHGASQYIAQAAIGCLKGTVTASISKSDQSTGCSSGAGGAVISQLMIEYVDTLATKVDQSPSAANYDQLQNASKFMSENGGDMARLVSAFAAFATKGDVNIASDAGGSVMGANSMHFASSASIYMDVMGAKYYGTDDFVAHMEAKAEDLVRLELLAKSNLTKAEVETLITKMRGADAFLQAAKIQDKYWQGGKNLQSLMVVKSASTQTTGGFVGLNSDGTTEEFLAEGVRDHSFSQEVLNFGGVTHRVLEDLDPRLTEGAGVAFNVLTGGPVKAAMGYLSSQVIEVMLPDEIKQKVGEITATVNTAIGTGFAGILADLSYSDVKGSIANKNESLSDNVEGMGWLAQNGIGLIIPDRKAKTSEQSAKIHESFESEKQARAASQNNPRRLPSATSFSRAQVRDHFANNNIPLKEGWTPDRLYDEVFSKPKADRPAPSVYLPASYIAEHLAKFEGGASRLMLKDKIVQYGPSQRDGTSFVSPKADIDKALAAAGGDPVKLAKSLGLEDNFFVGHEVVRVDIPDPKSVGLRLPSGSEAGANTQWLAGGKLPFGLDEATVDLTRAGENITWKQTTINF